MIKTCERCGIYYATTDKRRRFCGAACYHEHQRETPNGGTFRQGIEPWNKGLAGIHLSPASEFKPGQPARNHEPVGTVKVRRRKNRPESPRAFVKVAEPNTWRLRAVVVWEAAHGPLPRGCVVHHRDRNSLNDAIENLQALTRAAHLAEHRREFRRSAA